MHIEAAVFVRPVVTGNAPWLIVQPQAMKRAGRVPLSVAVDLLVCQGSEESGE
jgi:hypothetical protein